MTQSYGQVDFDTVYIVRHVQPSQEELYDLLVSRKAEIESKGGWIEKDMLYFAKHVSELEDVVSQKRIDKKFRKLNVATIWVDSINGTDIENNFRMEFGYGLTVFKRGGKMMSPTIKLYDKKGDIYFEGNSDDLFKKLKKNKA